MKKVVRSNYELTNGEMLLACLCVYFFLLVWLTSMKNNDMIVYTLCVFLSGWGTIVIIKNLFVWISSRKVYWEEVT